MIQQGDVYWAEMGPPLGSEPGYRHPVVVVQSDDFNASNLSTVVCVLCTSNLNLAGAPGNVFLDAQTTRMPKDSVANVTQVVTLDRQRLRKRITHLPAQTTEAILSGLEVMLGR